MKNILFILLLVSASFGSKYGEVLIVDSSGNTAAITPDSSLKVFIDSTDSNKTFVNIGSGGIPYARDASTNGFTVIEYEHHEIHSGSHYFICDYTTVASGDSLDWQLTTSNTTKWIHMTFQVEGTQEFTIEVFENATVAADGSAATARNNNRNSDNVTSLTLIQCCGTVSAVGTRIFGEQTGVAGNSNKARQGATQRSKELILKQNTTYRFVITSAGNGNNISYCGEWYEHTDKN